MSDASIYNGTFKLSTLNISDEIIFNDGTTQNTAYTDAPLSTSTYTITTINDTTNNIIGTLSSSLTLINVFGNNIGSFYFRQANANIYILNLVFENVFTGDISLTIVDVNNNAPIYTTNNNIYIINLVTNTLYYGYTELNTSGVLSFNFPNIAINDTDGFEIYISTFQYIIN
jgi:hypothetical protein